MTHFNIDGVDHDTSSAVSSAVSDLRSFIVQGAWTKNQYQRFVILNLFKSSEQIARSYSARSYKSSSTRTLRTDGINKLMKIIPFEYLAALYQGDPSSKYDYNQQRKACRFIRYITDLNLSMDDFTTEYKNAVQFELTEPKKCTLAECKKELKFLALNYSGYLNLQGSLDAKKLSYINSLLSEGVHADINEDDAEILLSLADTIKQLSSWIDK